MRSSRPRSGGTIEFCFAPPVEIPEALRTLVVALESALRGGGFTFDEKPYPPHLTLVCRARFGASALRFPKVTWQMNDFALVRSHRERQGSPYELLESWPLSAK